MDKIPIENSATAGLHEKVNKLELDVATVNKLMVGVNIVMFLGFISLTVAFIGVTLDSFRYKVSTQEEMRDEIKEANLKLDFFTQSQDPVKTLPIQTIITNPKE